MQKVFWQWRRIYEYERFVSPLSQLDRKNIGGEFSFEYQITSTIKGSFPRDTVSLLMIVILMWVLITMHWLP
jgi:hypothetical protein